MDELYHKRPRQQYTVVIENREDGTDVLAEVHDVTVLSLAQGLGLEFVPLEALHFLAGPDIARCGSVNRFLYQAATNEGLWQATRDRLWEGKVHIPSCAKRMKAKAGYIASLQDSKRTWLGLDELTSFSWWFRFKQQAGEAWTAHDPWYRNEKVRRHQALSAPSETIVQLCSTFSSHRLVAGCFAFRSCLCQPPGRTNKLYTSP